MAYKAIVGYVGCIDARIHNLTEEWLSKNFGSGMVDRILRAGATAYGNSVIEEVAEAHGLHHFPILVVAHHTDCGKLSSFGRDAHIEQMRAFARHIHEEIPELVVQIVLVHTEEQYVEVIETLFDDSEVE
ncbi:MAG: hypothetical protein OEX81_04220 [Candidatus Pacebacteria bacterium]|nr:hypothetical protein [Candidatus Paceibacterota bacterium]